MTTAFAPASLIDRAAFTAGRALIRWAVRRAEVTVVDRDEALRRFIAARDRASRERACERSLLLVRR